MNDNNDKRICRQSADGADEFVEARETNLVIVVLPITVFRVVPLLAET